MAAIWLWAGLEKIRNLSPIVITIRNLGLSHQFAWQSALFLATAELVLGVAVLFRPDFVLTHIGIVVLAGLFGIAGLIAIRRDEPIECSCFGVGGKGYLGITQIFALFPWFAGVAVLRLGAQEAPPLHIGAAYFALISLVITAVRGIGIWKALLEARGDRVSANEMYIWLQSH